MTRPMTPLILLATLPAILALAACRGETSPNPPLHPVLDMDFQEKFKAQTKSEFFKDGRAMRMPVVGTVARGELFEHDPDPEVRKLYTYKNGDVYVTKNPLPRTPGNLERGRERYNIYCAICHGQTGRGDGPVGLRWPVKPTSYLSVAGPVPFPDRVGDDQKPDRMDQRVQNLSDGEMFETIANGKATMPAYGHMVTVEDRWKIIHYIRALQLRVKKR